jgi:hypothetical protein
MVNVYTQLYRRIYLCQFQTAQGILRQGLQFQYVWEATSICIAPLYKAPLYKALSTGIGS